MKQFKCSSTGEGINKLWYMHTMECRSTIKRNEPLIHATAWMNLNNILLSERSQTQKATFCMISLHKMSRESKYLETEIRSVIAWNWGWGGDGMRDLLQVMETF